jgi:DNA-binding winged helix-turn-helix (wHTH) protein
MSPVQTKESITGEYPVLVALEGPLEGRRWIIKNLILIGREPDCTVAIEDRQVSRHHARVTNTKGVCELEDLGSKNGTYYLGKQINEKIQLNDGDMVQVALIQKFAFYSSDATMPMQDLDPSRYLHSGRLALDKKSRRVWVGNVELTPPLSAAQYRLLQCLYDQAGKVISREELIQATWEDDHITGVSDQALDALIRRLRERIAEADKKHQYIVTVRGHGIRLENNF